jgi:peroxiredoxin
MRGLTLLLLTGIIFLIGNAGSAQVRLTDPDGRPAEFRTAIPGQYQVVVFLLADCPACQSYTKTLNELSRTYGKKGISFCGIFPGHYQSREEMQEFRRIYKIGFPLYADPENSLVRKLRATTAPQVFVLDPSGNTVYSGRIDDWMYAVGKKRAVITRHDLRSALEAVTAGRKPDPSQTVPIGCIID